MALSGAFKLFDADNDVVKNIKSTISSGIWSGGVGTLSAYYTQSAQSSSLGDYYYDLYKTSPLTDSEAEVQFSITYGHLHGSGSLGTRGAATGNRATAAIHSQLVNLLLGPLVDRFTYAADTSSKHFYAISLKRARMREKVDPGNWELHISASGAAGSLNLTAGTASGSAAGGTVTITAGRDTSGSADGSIILKTYTAASATAAITVGAEGQDVTINTGNIIMSSKGIYMRNSSSPQVIKYCATPGVGVDDTAIFTTAMILTGLITITATADRAKALPSATDSQQWFP